MQSGESTGAYARCRKNASKRILVVEDDVDIRRMNAQALSRFGYQIETAEDGAEAWEELQANGYDLLITDNSMPKVSGIELVKMLRSAHMTLPVVLASGTIPTEALNGNTSLQIAGTLLKPFRTEELLALVRKVLRESDSAREQIELPRIRRGKRVPKCAGMPTGSLVSHEAKPLRREKNRPGPTLCFK